MFAGRSERNIKNKAAAYLSLWSRGLSLSQEQSQLRRAVVASRGGGGRNEREDGGRGHLSQMRKGGGI